MNKTIAERVTGIVIITGSKEFQQITQIAEAAARKNRSGNAQRTGRVDGKTVTVRVKTANGKPQVNSFNIGRKTFK